ncbi:DUF802 domain-containing protein [Rhodoferax ferrireducens]|uniref:DUF802 domain-containing protein n=1 Tax=Rhodoferax ferrireducens TaxID=192843 RepID=UPI000E0D2513|nr:DUF802 domain-containing protein [Rhodoferax ferrireducens]
MNRNLFTIAFLLGAAAVVWVGAGFMGAHVLALTMTMIIGAVYGFGALELRQFRQASATLTTSLAAIPDPLTNLGDWLDGVHPSLQNAVRLRIEGERIGLPGPALTPYLVGLLVMLGMLGTFLGMVVTLNGAAFSLEGTTDLQAIRTALAAPIKGLGLAFGTSVAGVATSAMLGLMSALSRRERMQAAQLLDTKIATVLRGFSLTHQRQEAYKALQFQAQALPEVVDKLQAMMAQMERMSQQLNERLLTNQESFHGEVKGIYSDLASSVDKSLRDSLTQSAQVAGESLKPVVEAAMTGIAKEARLLHERVIDTAQLQLDGLSERFSATASTVANTWTAALADHERTSENMVTGVGQSLAAFNDTFEQRSTSLLIATNEAHATLQADQASSDRQRLDAWMSSLESMAAGLHREWQETGAQTLSQQQAICHTLTQTAQAITEQARSSASHTLGEITRLTTCSEELLRSRIASEANWIEQHSARMDQVTSLLRTELGALRNEEVQRGHAAVERLGELQAALTSHLTTLGVALEDPITRLIETASEAPRAAAEVIGQLRQEMSSSIVRDNELLDERSRIMETLNSLLDGINHASAEQRAVIDSLVTTSAEALNQAGGQFAEKVDLEAAKLSDIAAHVTSSAVEVSSLSESFAFAVNSFNEANEKLIGNLQRIEAAMDKSMARSDDQLAYYVGQAREIIDLSIMSQKEIFEELRQLPGKQALSAEEVS